MNRKDFIYNSSKFLLGATILPQASMALGYTSPPPPLYAALLRKAFPIVVGFLKKITQEGVKKYGTDQVAYWLEDHLGSTENKKQQINKLPSPILNNNIVINGGQIDIFVGLDAKKRPEAILIPALQDLKVNHAKLISSHSFIPIYNKKIHLENPNFIELAALDQLTKYYLENLNLGRYSIMYLQRALLPTSHKSAKVREIFTVDHPHKSIGSSVIKTQDGWIHITYEINDQLKAEGQIAYVADERFSKIPSRKIDFSYDFN